jgi:hypothetical protein
VREVRGWVLLGASWLKVCERAIEWPYFEWYCVFPSIRTARAIMLAVFVVVAACIFDDCFHSGLSTINHAIQLLADWLNE